MNGSINNWTEIKPLIQERISASKILVVDDNKENLILLKTTLKKENNHLDYAPNGYSALKALNNQEYDLILLDIEMLGNSGFEICRKLRLNIKYNNTPIIFITALSDQKSRDKGISLGAQDYIVKPYNINELILRINTQLELRHFREIQYSLNLWVEGRIDQKSAQLNRTIQDISIRNITKYDFVYEITREINRSIDHIYNQIDQLDKKAQHFDMLESRNKLAILVGRLERLTLDEMIITKFFSCEKTCDNNPFYLEEAIKLSAEELNRELKYKNIEILYRTGRPRFLIQGSLQMLRICLTNILSNGIKFSPPGGKIHIKLARKNLQMVCEIRDQGSGFSKIALTKLNSLFTSGSNSLNHNVAIDQIFLKTVMKKYKGKVRVKNAKGQGAIVCLHFQSCDLN